MKKMLDKILRGVQGWKKWQAIWLFLANGLILGISIYMGDSEFVVFPRNQYNSTAIRKDIYGHWDWMPQVVRAYYTKKVLLIGGESVRKSTLTINLAHYYNTNYLEEVGRELSELSGTDVTCFLRILPEYC